jgi:hypothetical protein
MRGRWGSRVQIPPQGAESLSSKVISDSCEDEGIRTPDPACKFDAPFLPLCQCRGVPSCAGFSPQFSRPLSPCSMPPGSNPAAASWRRLATILSGGRSPIGGSQSRMLRSSVLWELLPRIRTDVSSAPAAGLSALRRSSTGRAFITLDVINASRYYRSCDRKLPGQGNRKHLSAGKISEARIRRSAGCSAQISHAGCRTVASGPACSARKPS